MTATLQEALLLERSGYLKRGLPDRAALVEAELRRLGVEVGAAADDEPEQAVDDEPESPEDDEPEQAVDDEPENTNGPQVRRGGRRR